MPCPPKTKIGHHRIMPPFPLVGGSPAKPTPARLQPPTRLPATHVCAHFRQTDVLRLRRFWCRRCPTAPTRRAFAGLTAELNEEQPPSKSSRTSLFAAPQCLPHVNVCCKVKSPRGHFLFMFNFFFITFCLLESFILI